MSQGLLLLAEVHNAAARSQQCSCAHIKPALSYTLYNQTIKLHFDFQNYSYWVFSNRKSSSRGFELSSTDSTELYLNVCGWL